MKKHVLVVSDLHLADVEDNPDGWKYYKSSRYLFDEEFAALLKRFLDRAGSAERLLVLNGDIFDFDLVTAVPDDPPWPVSRSERRRGLDPEEAKSAWKLQRMLDDHPRFLDALAGFVAAGGRLVYVLGNHDREFYFPAVQQVLLRALDERLRRRGGGLGDADLVFEPWFFRLPGLLHAEHGQQYDSYTAFRDVLQPLVTVRGRQLLALPMGNLSNRYLMTRMGFFNPHASDYIHGVWGYFRHWLRHYAFSRRSLLFVWFWGSLVVLGRLLRRRRWRRRQMPDLEELLAEQSRRYRLERETVNRLYRLQDRPVGGKLYQVMREFWIDRVLLALLMTGGTVTLALVPIPLWIKLTVPLMGFPLVYFIYERLALGRTIFDFESRLPRVAGRIAELTGVPVVSFGHTHNSRLVPLGPGRSFVDTGTWAPLTDDQGRLRPGLRNWLWLEQDGERLQLRLDCAGGGREGQGEDGQ